MRSFLIIISIEPRINRRRHSISVHPGVVLGLDILPVAVYLPDCALLCHCACSLLFFSPSFLLPLLVLDLCLHTLRPSLAQCLAICALAHHIAVFESEAARAFVDWFTRHAPVPSPLVVRVVTDASSLTSIRRRSDCIPRAVESRRASALPSPACAICGVRSTHISSWVLFLPCYLGGSSCARYLPVSTC